jgi:uncharacterized protein
MDIFLLIIAILLQIIGIAGCILPVIPGPLVSFLGLWVLDFTKYAAFSNTFLMIFLIVSLVVLAIDFFIPVWGTKQFGGFKQGVYGATAGLLAGAFIFPPWGIIIGPFIGAFIVEILRGESTEKSFKAGLGSLFGFIIGTGLKLTASGVMAWYFVVELI